MLGENANNSVGHLWYVLLLPFPSGIGRWRLLDVPQPKEADRSPGAVETLSSVAKDLSDIPKLIAGHGNAAGAIAIEVAKLRDSIDRFVGVVVKPRETEAGVDYTKEEDASLHWEVAQVLAEDPSVGIERAKEIAEGRIAEQVALPHLGME